MTCSSAGSEGSGHGREEWSWSTVLGAVQRCLRPESAWSTAAHCRQLSVSVTESRSDRDKVCDIIVSVDGHPKMRELGESMKRRLHTGKCVVSWCVGGR